LAGRSARPDSREIERGSLTADTLGELAEMMGLDADAI
jgi:hypothetical protein